MVLTNSVRLFWFDKINHRLRLYCTIDRSSLVNCTILYIYLKLWDITATADSTSGRRFCALFECVVHHPEPEMKGREIFNLPGQTSQQPLDPFSSNSVAKQNGAVLELFLRFCQGTENRGFNRIQTFFHRSISNNEQIRFSEKHFGVRSTLTK